MYDAGEPVRRKSLSGLAFPASSTAPDVCVEVRTTLVACSTTDADDRFAPAAEHNCTLMGIVLPLFAAFAGSYRRQTLKRTVTVNDAEPTLWCASVDVQITVVVP